MAKPMDTSTGVNPPAYTSVQLGKRKALEFVEDMARETPSKSRRLTIAAEIAVSEREREKVYSRIRKNQERARDLLAKIENDEIEKARLDEKICG